MFPYEKEWFQLKAYIMCRERLSKAETMTKMAELEVARACTEGRPLGKMRIPPEDTE